jgi:uncharacterized protein YcbK (DUF882 family)
VTRLSEHFDSREFGCHCGCGLDTPAPALIAALEQLRAAAGRPVRVLSGLRCAEHNAKVGGAADSRHPTGEAADIVVAAMPLSELVVIAAGTPAFYRGGIGVYPGDGFVHVDVRPVMARWGHLDGRYVAFRDAWQRLKALESGGAV